MTLLWATSKTWTRTLDPDPEKPGPRKTWTLKNLDSEKPGPWKTWTLKNLDPEKTQSIIKTKSRFLITKYSVPTRLIRIELLELTVWVLSFKSIRSSRPEMSCYRRSHRRCSVKKVFLEISQNSRKTPVLESLF